MKNNNLKEDNYYSVLFCPCINLIKKTPQRYIPSSQALIIRKNHPQSINSKKISLKKSLLISARETYVTESRNGSSFKRYHKQNENWLKQLSTSKIEEIQQNQTHLNISQNLLKPQSFYDNHLKIKQTIQQKKDLNRKQQIKQNLIIHQVSQIDSINKKNLFFRYSNKQIQPLLSVILEDSEQCRASEHSINNPSYDQSNRSNEVIYSKYNFSSSNLNISNINNNTSALMSQNRSSILQKICTVEIQNKQENIIQQKIEVHQSKQNLFLQFREQDKDDKNDVIKHEEDDEMKIDPNTAFRKKNKHRNTLNQLVQKKVQSITTSKNINDDGSQVLISYRKYLKKHQQTSLKNLESNPSFQKLENGEYGQVSLNSLLQTYKK